MIGGTALSSVLGALPGPTADDDEVRGYIRALCNAGLAVVMIEPGSKHPVDMRSAQARTKDDAAARDSAREAGRPDWNKARSKSGSHLATSDSVVALRYWKQYRKTYPDHPVNLAVELGRSRIVVVDCDTPEQLSGFLTDSGADADVPPTVTSPGFQDAEGNWLHHGGGHFWFTLPDDVELPAGAGSWTAPTGYAVLWRDRYVLIPPSVRPEGSYELTGRPYELPEWLAATITDVSTQRETRRLAHTSEAGDDLAEQVIKWAQRVDWADLLAAQGWSLTGRTDSCGCPCWTAPGEHTNPKSATAHDSGCMLGIYTEVNAPLHIWTDNPPAEFVDFINAHGGSRTLSKLQVAAVVSYKGNVGTACAELGIIPGKDSLAFEMGTDANEITSETETSTDNLDAELEDLVRQHNSTEPSPADQETDDETDSGTTDFPDETEHEPDDEVLSSLITGVPTIAPFDHWRDIPAPEYAIEGLIEHQGLTALVGPPGVGKSTLALDMACHLVTGKRWQTRAVTAQRVLYLPGEGLAGAVSRIKAWEAAHELNVGRDLLLGNNIIQLGASREAWAELAGYLLNHQVSLIIFDTFARMSLGLDENSASDVGRAVTRFRQIQQLTNAGVMVVHHTGKNGTTRGSSALNGALDTELGVKMVDARDRDFVPDGSTPLELDTIKQKNAPRLRDPINLCLTPHSESVVVTTAGGMVDGDALDTVDVPVRRVPEPMVETAIRLQQYLTRVTEQGATRSEIALAVMPDAWTINQPNTTGIWKRVVAEAVDMGLRYDLLETLTGQRTGSRYVPGPATPDEARARAANDVVTD